MSPLDACPDDGDDDCPLHIADEQPDAEDEIDPGDFDLEVVHDLRAVIRPANDRGRTIRIRPWTSVLGLCDHQTGCLIGPEHPGLAHIPAHVLIFRDGTIALLHWFTDYVQHGHRLNAGTVGNEVVCRASGIAGNPRSFWRSPKEKQRGQGYDELVHEATDAQLVALANVHRYECEVVSACGGRIRGIWAHRQGHASRTTDPGSRIWAVAQDSTIELGLADVQDYHLGSGKPIPGAWGR